MYIVPGMKMIPQSLDSSCWYASAQMLIQWKRRRGRQTFAASPSPGEVPALRKKYRDHGDLKNDEIARFAALLGFAVIPPMTPTSAAIKDLLIRYGPLWTNGQTHIVVIAGVKTHHQRSQLLVYDPWPPHKGQIVWRPFVRWFIKGAAEDSIDVSPETKASFLYLP